MRSVSGSSIWFALVSMCRALFSEIERVPASQVSVDSFLSKYSGRQRPVVIEGLASSWPLALMTNGSEVKALLADECDSGPFQPLNLQRGSGEWADLVPSKMEPVGITEFLQTGLYQGSPHYLHDEPVCRRCGQGLLDGITIPDIFSVNILRHGVSKLGSFVGSWPAMFVGSPGTESGLHFDTSATNFWMALLHGSKEFVVFDPADLGHLGGKDCELSKYCASFTADAFNNDSLKKTYGKANPMRALLESGDVIFIPANWPHQARNVQSSGIAPDDDFSLAVSANYVDETNLAAYKDYLEFDCSKAVVKRKNSKEGDHRDIRMNRAACSQMLRILNLEHSEIGIIRPEERRNVSVAEYNGLSKCPPDDDEVEALYKKNDESRVGGSGLLGKCDNIRKGAKIAQDVNALTEQIDRCGYVVLEELIDDHALKRIRDEYADGILFTSEMSRNKAAFATLRKARCEVYIPYIPSIVSDLMLPKVVLDVVRNVTGENATLDYMSFIDAYPGTETQGFHKDDAEHGHQLSIHVMTQDVAPDMGPLHICPGSHNIEAFVCDDMVAVQNKVGTTVLYRADVLHRGSGNTATSADKHRITLNYFFATSIETGFIANMSPDVFESAKFEIKCWQSYFEPLIFPDRRQMPGHEWRCNKTTGFVLLLFSEDANNAWTDVMKLLEEMARRDGVSTDAGGSELGLRGFNIGASQEDVVFIEQVLSRRSCSSDIRIKNMVVSDDCSSSPHAVLYDETARNMYAIGDLRKEKRFTSEDLQLLLFHPPNFERHEVSCPPTILNERLLDRLWKEHQPKVIINVDDMGHPVALAAQEILHKVAGKVHILVLNGDTVLNEAPLQVLTGACTKDDLKYPTVSFYSTNSPLDGGYGPILSFNNFTKGLSADDYAKFLLDAIDVVVSPDNPEKGILYSKRAAKYSPEIAAAAPMRFLPMTTPQTWMLLSNSLFTNNEGATTHHFYTFFDEHKHHEHAKAITKRLAELDSYDENDATADVISPSVCGDLKLYFRIRPSNPFIVMVPTAADAVDLRRNVVKSMPSYEEMGDREFQKSTKEIFAMSLDADSTANLCLSTKASCHICLINELPGGRTPDPGHIGTRSVMRNRDRFLHVSPFFMWAPKTTLMEEVSGTSGHDEF